MRTTRTNWALLALSALAVTVMIGTLDRSDGPPATRVEQEFVPESMGSPRRLRPPFQAPFEMTDPARMILYTAPFPANR